MPSVEKIGARSSWVPKVSWVFFSGSDGVILHYNGTTFSAMTTGTNEILYSLWGAAPDDVFAAGNANDILRYGPVCR